MSQTVFWTVATVMVVFATTAVLAPMFWLRTGDARDFSRRRLWSAAALAALLPLGALGLYALLGSPLLIGMSPTAATSPAPHPGARRPDVDPAVMTRGQTAGELGAAVAKLEARLATQPDDAPGWDLLVQSYEFAGRAADAAAARQRRLPPVRAGGTATADEGRSTSPDGNAPRTAGLDPGAIAAVAASLPSGSNALIQQAQDARRERDFPRAIAAFEKLSRQGALDAGLWSDYADATAAQHGQLDDISEAMIRKALALEPAHPKALWLLGSLQIQRRDFASALTTWERLLAVIPAESSDARLIAENLAEARAMLGAAAPALRTANAVVSPRVSATPAPVPTKPPSASVAVRGEITLDPRWKDKVTAQTVLYVFARAVGQSGPPVAVLRTTAGAWPHRFLLDDSLAMMPDRMLSGASSVIVEARLSRSGSADPQPGDLRGLSAALDPRKTVPLRIVISDEIT